MFAHFIVGDLPAYLPTPHECSAVSSKNAMTLVPQLPCSPDRTLSDFLLLFPLMKKVLKGKVPVWDR